jgi:hypothetical protein
MRAWQTLLYAAFTQASTTSPTVAALFSRDTINLSSALSEWGLLSAWGTPSIKELLMG